jgi:hypothetical protein
MSYGFLVFVFLFKQCLNSRNRLVSAYLFKVVSVIVVINLNTFWGIRVSLCWHLFVSCASFPASDTYLELFFGSVNWNTCYTDENRNYCISLKLNWNTHPTGCDRWFPLISFSSSFASECPHLLLHHRNKNTFISLFLVITFLELLVTTIILF